MGRDFQVGLNELQKESITTSIALAQPTANPPITGSDIRLANITRIDIGGGAVEEVDGTENSAIMSIGIFQVTKIIAIPGAPLSNPGFELTGISVWPIPTRDKLNIQVGEKADYRLINIRGQVLKRGHLKEGRNSVDILPLSKGVYFLNIITNKGSLTKKVVRN